MSPAGAGAWQKNIPGLHSICAVCITMLNDQFEESWIVQLGALCVFTTFIKGDHQGTSAVVVKN